MISAWKGGHDFSLMRIQTNNLLCRGIMKFLHRVFFFSLLLIAAIWASFSLKANPFELAANFEFFELLKLFYVFVATVIFWPLFYVELCDYFASRTGKNGKLYLQYSRSIQKDLVVSTCSSIVLASIYWLDAVPYQFSGVDIGFAGIPFFVSAIYASFQITNVKIAGKSVSKLPVILWVLILLIFFGFCYSLLLKNSSGGFSTYQAIWFQLTIVFGSVYAYTSVHLQLHFLEKGQFDLSEFKKYFFRDVVGSKYGLYEKMEKPIQELNRNTKTEKARHAKRLRKKKKKR